MSAVGFFVTGTDTGVGKTLVSAALLRAFTENGYRTAGMKPVASGSAVTAQGLRNEDALRLQSAASLPAAYETVNPVVFEPAIAPHIAAREAGVDISLPLLLGCYRRLAGQAEVVVVEGVGGFRVPLGPALDTADFARALGLPVVLVVGMRLGCLNHALLTADAIARTGLRLAGWVANAVEPEFARREENRETLRERLGAAMVADLPHMSKADPAVAAGYLDISPLIGDGAGRRN